MSDFSTKGLSSGGWHNRLYKEGTGKDLRGRVGAASGQVRFVISFFQHSVSSVFSVVNKLVAFGPVFLSLWRDLP